MRSFTKQKLLTICFYTALILAVLAPAVFAQDGSVTGAKTILENALEVSEKSQEGLDKLWNETFTGNFSPAFRATTDFAKQIMVIPFFWLFIPISRAFVFNRYEEIFKHVCWLMVVAALVVNNFALTATLTLGTRNWIDATTFGILEQQLGEVTMIEALNDVLVTETAKDIIRIELAECEAKEGEEQKQCFKDGAGRAADAIEKGDSQFLPGVRRLLGRLKAVVNGSADTALGKFNQSPQALFEFIYQSAGQALTQELMKGFQHALVSMIDIGFFLTGILGPVAVALSLAPIQPRVIMIWATGFFSFGMMKMSYNILIGAIATVAQLINAGDVHSTGLLISMGIFSPLLAMAMSAWGGAKIVHAMVGGTTALIDLL